MYSVRIFRRVLFVEIIVAAILLVVNIIIFIGNSSVKELIGDINCSSYEYLSYNDQIMYKSDLIVGDEEKSLMSLLSAKIDDSYLGSDIKVVIFDTQPVIDEIMIRGYQMVDNVILEDTFFALTVDEYDDIGYYMVNPGSINTAGILPTDNVEGNISLAISEKEAEKTGPCKYALYFTHFGNSMIDKDSAFYYEYNLGWDRIYINAETGEIEKIYRPPKIIP